MKSLLFTSCLFLSSCGGSFTGEIQTPFGSGGYSSENGTVLTVDAGAILDAILEVEAQK